MISFIGPKEIVEYLDRKDILLIDLRDKEEYEEFHLRNAINIPYETIMNRNCNKNKCLTMILYCDKGNLSVKAGLKLDREGYTVFSLTGGFEGMKAYYGN